MPKQMDLTEKACQIWDSMSESEQFGVSFGLFPAEKIDEAVNAGFDQHELVMMLMKIARPTIHAA